MRKADIISGGLVAVFGLALLLVIIPIWVPTILEGSYGLRAKDMPNVAAVTATALAVFLVVSRIRVGKTKADATPPISLENWWFLLRGAVFLTVVAYKQEYDYVVVNDDLETAINQIETILRGE